MYVKRPVEYVEGRSFGGGTARSTVPRDCAPARDFPNRRRGYGAVRAIDPQTGERKWEYKMADFTEAGILTTASDLLFTGGREGYFFALDARTGALLWKSRSAARSPRGR